MSSKNTRTNSNAVIAEQPAIVPAMPVFAYPLGKFEEGKEYQLGNIMAASEGNVTPMDVAYNKVLVAIQNMESDEIEANIDAALQALKTRTESNVVPAHDPQARYSVPSANAEHAASASELAAYLKKYAGVPDFQHLKAEHAYISIALKVDSSEKVWVYNPTSALVSFVSPKDVKRDDSMVFVVRVARLVGVDFQNQDLRVDSVYWADKQYLFARVNGELSMLTKDGTGRYRVLVSLDDADANMAIAMKHAESARVNYQKRVSNGESPRKLQTLISLGGGKWALTDYGMGRLATNTLSADDRNKLAGITPTKKLGKGNK